VSSRISRESYRLDAHQAHAPECFRPGTAVARPSQAPAQRLAALGSRVARADVVACERIIGRDDGEVLELGLGDEEPVGWIGPFTCRLVATYDSLPSVGAVARERTV